jgi:hypothetical protein
MKTDQLVAALVADRRQSVGPPGRSIVSAIAAGSVVSLVIFALAFGPRVDLAAAFATWRFDLKLVLVFTALLVALAGSAALARPLTPGPLLSRAWPLILLAVAAVTIELVLQPRDAWLTRLVGSNALVCLTAIPLFSLAPLAGLMVALRRAAPASPTRAGAMAGALAAAVAASIYAFHCFDDSPLFVLTWYSLATLPVVALGALVGSRLLRW